MHCRLDYRIPIGYTDSYFMSDKDLRKLTSGHLFTLGCGAVSWRSIKQKCIADSTIKVEYVASYEVAKEAIWLKKFLMELEVVLASLSPITLYCDNSGAVAQSKEPRNHGKGKHVERKYHLIRDIVQHRDVTVTKIATFDNLAYPFTNALPQKVFECHLDSLGLRCSSNEL